MRHLLRGLWVGEKRNRVLVSTGFAAERRMQHVLGEYHHVPRLRFHRHAGYFTEVHPERAEIGVFVATTQDGVRIRVAG